MCIGSKKLVKDFVVMHILSTVLKTCDILFFEISLMRSVLFLMTLEGV